MMIKLPGCGPDSGFVVFGECLLKVVDHYFLSVSCHMVHQEIEKIGDPEQDPIGQQVKQPDRSIDWKALNTTN